MKVLVTGVKGQLGFDVVNELKKRGHTPIGVDVDDMDITDAVAVEKVITDAAPDAVIHCAHIPLLIRRRIMKKYAEKLTHMERKISLRSAKNLIVR